MGSCRRAFLREGSMRVRTEIPLYMRLLLWVEDDATQLGMDVVTYYGICCVVGLIQGLAIGRLITRLF